MKHKCQDLWYDNIANERLSQESTEIFIEVSQAIEWLKQEIKTRSTRMYSGTDIVNGKKETWQACSLDNPPVFIQEGLVLKLIDEAFEDLVK